MYKFLQSFRISYLVSGICTVILAEKHNSALLGVLGAVLLGFYDWSLRVKE